MFAEIKELSFQHSTHDEWKVTITESITYTYAAVLVTLNDLTDHFVHCGVKDSLEYL